MTRARVLVLEDDPDWVHELTSYLEDDYEVQAACSLAQARELLEEKSFHMVTVDISLGLGGPMDEGGFRLIESIRSTSILREMSIIVITAYSTPERIRRAFRDYKVYDIIDKMTLDPLQFKQVVAEAIVGNANIE
jgi:DNA-binding NtrC family response regulator